MRQHVRRAVQVFAVVVFTAWSSGCATLFGGGAEAVTIQSEPSGARVTTQSGQVLGTTPFTTQLSPEKEYLLTFARQGHETATYTLERKIEGIAFLNLLCVLCWGIDFATGNLWGFEDNIINVTLNPSTRAALPSREVIACANYNALRDTESQGRITTDVREAGERLVEQSTGVAASSCADDQQRHEAGAGDVRR